MSLGVAGRIPAWLLGATLAALLGVGALLWAETQVLRPYYSVGDESIHVADMLAIGHAKPLQWRWTRGDLERNAQWAWWRAVGSGPGRVLRLTLLVFALELALLAAVARRWWGPEAAAWALCTDLLCADTWMRARSFLAFAWLPAELLLLAWLSGQVRSRWAALLWGAAAACLVLDYEGALIALPGLLLACLALEPLFRRRAAWMLAGFGGALALILRLQGAVLASYGSVRHSVNAGDGAAAIAASWAHNLWQLLCGGEPMPYFSVQHWPAVALWSLPLLALGTAVAWRHGRWAVVLWAAVAVLAGQASLAPYGVPAHRLSAAWPALCLLGGAGGAWMTERLQDRAWLWMGLLLALGSAAELDAFYRHMAIFGERLWGRSRNMAVAAEIVRQHCPPGVSVDTGLMEVVQPSIGFHLAPRTGQGVQAWVLLPAELRCVAAGVGRVTALHHGMNDEPVLLVQAEGAQARRFDAMEKDLRGMLPLSTEPPEIPGQQLAWLARGGHDPLARWTVVAANLKTFWLGQPVDRGVLDSVLSSNAPVPAPWAVAGYYAVLQKKDYGLRLLDHASSLDPYYSPALLWKAAGLRVLGRGAEADAVQALAQQRQRQGQWIVGE